jgi:hypothetical protein
VSRSLYVRGPFFCCCHCGAPRVNADEVVWLSEVFGTPTRSSITLDMETVAAQMLDVLVYVTLLRVWLFGCDVFGPSSSVVAFTHVSTLPAACRSAGGAAGRTGNSSSTQAIVCFAFKFDGPTHWWCPVSVLCGVGHAWDRYPELGSEGKTFALAMARLAPIQVCPSSWLTCMGLPVVWTTWLIVAVAHCRAS